MSLKSASSPSQAPDALSGKDSSIAYYATLSLFLLTTLLFLRSVLPRIPRLFSSGKLRVKRVGLRGFRGIEWRAQGFPQQGHFFQKQPRQLDASTSTPYNNGSVIKVEHAYLKFNLWSKAARGSDYATSDLPDRRSWLTIHVQGVGVQMPRASEEQQRKATERAIEKAKQQQRKEDEDQRKAQEAAEKRLDDLVKESPSSTSYAGLRRPSLMSRQSSDPAASIPSRQQDHTIPESAPPASLLQLFQRRVLPSLRRSALESVRAILFVITSSLPALTSLVDVEVSRMEIYLQEAESVVRVHRIGLELSMALVSGRSTAMKDFCQAAMKSQQRSTSSTWRSMPNRLGSSARDAMGFVTAGLPAGRAGVRLDVQGVQIFEVDHAQAVSDQKDQKKKVASIGIRSSKHWLQAQNASKRASAAESNLNDSRSRRWANQCIDWADFGLESSATSLFTADTQWLSRSTDAGLIPASACLLEIKGSTKLELGLLLGPSLRLGVKEAIEMHFVLGDVNIGLDPVYRVVRIIEERKAVRTGPVPTVEGASGDRSGLSKHVAQQRKSPAAQALAGLRSLRVELPSVAVRSRTALSACPFADSLSKEDRDRLPDLLEMEAILRNATLTIGTSDPQDDLHRRWLGTCGIKKQGLVGSMTSSQGTDRPRTRVTEHRRAFQIDGRIGSLDVSCDVNRQEIPSRLFHMGELQAQARSTWTPFGLLQSAAEGKAGPVKYFVSDPNEQVLFADLSIGKIRGDTKLDTLAAILSFVEMRKAERRDLRRTLNINEPPRKNKMQLLDHVPKLAVGFQCLDVLYRVDSGSASSTDPGSQHDSSLIFRLPSFTFNAHGSYRDAFVNRSEGERRAAWKAFNNDELEWSVQDNRHVPSSIFNSPRIPANFSAFVDRFKGQLSPRSMSLSDYGRTSRSPSPSYFSNPNQRSISPTQANDMKATRRMAPTEDANARADFGDEDDSDDNVDEAVSAQQAFSRPDRVVRVPTRLTRRSSSLSQADSGIHYDLEINLSCPTMESFFVFSGHDPSARHSPFSNPEDKGCQPTSDLSDSEAEHEGTNDDGGPTSGCLTRRQLLAINNVELGLESTIPGTQHPVTADTSLKLHEHHSKIKGLLEEIDVELWHVRVLSSIANALDTLERAKQPFSQDVENEKVTPSDAEEDMGQKPLIEKFPGAFEFWVSIGGVLAHIGGTDPNCDPRYARGIGVESRRIVVEIISATGKADSNLNERAYWGARSALTLAEDVKVSAQALAARHGRAAISKLSFYETAIFPLLDIEQASQLLDEDLGGAQSQHGRTQRKARDPPADALFADAIWDFQHRQPAFETHARRRYHQEDKQHNFIAWLPYAALKASVFPRDAESGKPNGVKPPSEIVVESEGFNLLALKIQLLHTYCCLVAVAALRQLKPKRRQARVDGHDARRGAPESKAPSEHHKQARPVPSRSALAKLEISDIHLHIELPEEVKLFVHIRRLDCKACDQNGVVIQWESLMAAVESPRMLSTALWEEAARLRDFKIVVPKKKRHDELFSIDVAGDAASLRVPYGYVVHNIIDSASVAFKATKQLVHQFVKGSQDSIITPVGEDPKHLPHINLRVRMLTIEAQDDPIETRLNIIWRAGRDENRARLERAEAFEAKVAALSKDSGSVNASQASLGSTSAKSISARWRNRQNGENDTDSDSESNDGSMLSDHSSSDSASSEVPIDTESWCEKARQELAAYDSSSWVRRYANARAEQTRKEDAVLKAIFTNTSAHRHPVALPIQMAQPSRVAPLFRSTMSDLDITVGPPSFQEHELRDWIHKEGNGTPKDLPYSLLVPFHIDWKMDEWKWELRDYPLPLLHFPPRGHPSKNSKKEYGFRLKSDLCIAEHLSEGNQSIRHVPAIVVPAACGHPDAQEYGISVPKVAMPVKIYGSPDIELESKFPTRVCWGQSIQPAIADMVRVFDGITSPPHDPSPKLGFWDKLPLIMHNKWLLRWKGNSELHIHLKGSRDPYYIHGNGAGWVKCWRGDVEIRLGWENEDDEFLQFISDEYLLAIPDLRGYLDRAATGARDSAEPAPGVAGGTAGAGRSESSMTDSHFTKVCLRLSSGVRWGASLRHEHTCREGTCEQSHPCKGDAFYRECRFFNRRPHWDVIQRSREYMATLPEQDQTDSFYGWRSDFSHLGISIYSPKNGLTAYGKHRKQSDGSNNLYFSPLAWQHFWAWMRLFDSAMALPIRQGQLFPNGPPPSPKFGRHLGTIKYRFDIAPLFISHLYTQFSRVDWARGVNTMLGIKARLDAFRVDMHQRQQEMIKERPELKEAKKVFHKPFYEAEADFAGIDLRTLVGRFRDSSKQLLDFDDLDAEADENVNFLGGENPSDDQSLWIDIDDFVEVDFTPSVEETPEIRLIQALVCPHFNFYRRYDSQGEREDKNKDRPEHGREEAAGLEKTKFGNETEQTHTCLIGKGPSPGEVQTMLAHRRLEELQEQLEHAESRTDKSSDARNSIKDIRKRMELVTQHIEFIGQTYAEVDQQHEAEQVASHTAKIDDTQQNDGAANLSELMSDWDTFDDRFLIHNPTFFFSNQTRLILLRYYASSKKRKSIIHHMTARAIWNIRRLNKREDDKTVRPNTSRKPTQQSQAGSELLTGLLNDTMQYVMADSGAETKYGSSDAFLDTHIDASEGVSDEFKVRRSNICAFVKPQFVLTSQIDDASSVVITAVRMRLRNFAVMDPSVAEDDNVNGRVLSRNYFTLDGLQTFHPTPHAVLQSRGSRPAGCAISVPLETLIDMRQETSDFARIVSRTDASVRYDKFNRLRLHDSSRPVYTDKQGSSASTDHLRHYMDLLRVRCPRFAVSANSAHFGALYNIVTDLILYRDPVWREHAKRLETTLLSHDFKDVDALADAVSELQIRIRRILECDEEYQFHFDDLNDQGKQDFFHLKAEMADLADELLLLAEAITASEDSKGDDEKDKKSALRMEAHAQDLAWNMMGENEGELLAKLSIKRPSFTWLNKADNSAANSLTIVDLNAVDVRPEAHFAEIISKWGKTPEHPMARQGRFVNAVWSELAPVGGISIVDQFELDLHPLKVQLEMKVGRMIMDYVFGSKRHREREDRKRKEVLDAHASNAAHKSKSSHFSLFGGSSKSSENGDSGAASEVSSRRPSTSSEHRSSKASRSIVSDNSRQKLDSSRPASIRGDRSSDDEEEGEDYSQLAIAKRNAAQMRKRGSSNLTFVFFKLPETVFCLSYKGDKDKSITDIYDLVFRAPNIEYRNRTWGYEELVQHMKKDIFRAAWGQKTTILKSILSHRPRRPEALRNIREKQALLRKTSRENRGLSPLQLQVHPPSPQGLQSVGSELQAGYEEGLARGASIVELSSDDEPEDEARAGGGDDVSVNSEDARYGRSVIHERGGKQSRDSHTSSGSRFGRFLHDRLGTSSHGTNSGRSAGSLSRASSASDEGNKSGASPSQGNQTNVVRSRSPKPE